MVGREDRTEAGDDDLEGAVSIGQRLRVPDLEPDGEFAGFGARLLDERGRDVDPGDVRPGLSCPQRDRARARGDIEPRLARRRPEPIDELLVDWSQPEREPLVLGRSPEVGGSPARQSPD